MLDLPALRRAIAALEPPDAPGAEDLFGFGERAIDRALGGGLRRGAVHEVYARDAPDAATAAGFGFCLALRAAGGRALVWARQDFGDLEAGAPYGAGVAALGAEPAGTLLVRLRDAASVLKAAHEAARCAALGAVVAEIWGEPRVVDLKASRRLSLAAARSGVTLIMIRQTAEPSPSAAQSRWSVASSASTPLEGNAPGSPAFDIALLRHRAGLPSRVWRLEWDRDSLSFAAAPLSRDLAPAPADRALEPTNEISWRRAG